MPADDVTARLEALLAAAAAEAVRGIRMSEECAVHRHDDWVPVERHHVWPLGMGGPDTDANLVQVCANGHSAIHAYLDYLVRYGRDDTLNMDLVPSYIKRRFGPKVRDLARQGWVQAGRPRRPAAPPAGQG